MAALKPISIDTGNVLSNSHHKKPEIDRNFNGKLLKQSKHPGNKKTQSLDLSSMNLQS